MYKNLRKASSAMKGFLPVYMGETFSSGNVVEIEYIATGKLKPMLEEYANYMRLHFPIIQSLSYEQLNPILHQFAVADVTEINSMWRFSVMDVMCWDGYEDDLLRAIMPYRSSGKVYENVMKEIQKTIVGGNDDDDDIMPDVLVYSFIFYVLYEMDKTRSWDLHTIFHLKEDEYVSLYIDSCTFDPSIENGDRLSLDLELIVKCTSCIHKTFRTSMRVKGIGRYENGWEGKRKSSKEDLEELITEDGEETSSEEEKEVLDDGEEEREDIRPLRKRFKKYI